MESYYYITSCFAIFFILVYEDWRLVFKFICPLHFIILFIGVLNKSDVGSHKFIDIIKGGVDLCLFTVQILLASGDFNILGMTMQERLQCWLPSYHIYLYINILTTSSLFFVSYGITFPIYNRNERKTGLIWYRKKKVMPNLAK